MKEEGEKFIQTKTEGWITPEVTPAISSGIQSVQGGGRPLSRSERSFFEPRFGADFSSVRIHNDTRAASVARSVNARAFTFGHNVVFSAGEYSSDALSSRQLLAHELTHVVQQKGVQTSFHQVSLPDHFGNDKYEQEANQIIGTLAQRENVNIPSRLSTPFIQRAKVPTGIKLAKAKPFGHSDLKSDELKKKWRTYIGSTTLMQVTPSGNYKGHCVKEYLTEVANTCPPRFAELRPSSFCTASKCLDIGRWGSAGDASSGKMVTDGPDTFLDRHRTRHPQSLLEGTGINKCSVVCHQRYKFDRKHDLGSFFVIRNFREGSYTPPGSKKSIPITTGDVQKVPAGLKAPSKEEFVRDIAPDLQKRGVLIETPPIP